MTYSSFNLLIIVSILLNYYVRFSILFTKCTFCSVLVYMCCMVLMQSLQILKYSYYVSRFHTSGLAISSCPILLSALTAASFTVTSLASVANLNSNGIVSGIPALLRARMFMHLHVSSWHFSSLEMMAFWMSCTIYKGVLRDWWRVKIINIARF